MMIKFQNKSLDANSDKNTGSCAKLVNYLEHEDNERLELGKEVLPFFTPEGTAITDAEVISKIDRNIKGLCKNDTKFYHIVAAFSEEEIEAMGDNEEEIVISAMEFAKQISSAYARNFHREDIENADDVLIFWKIHLTRGDNDIGQLHLHGIASHKDKHNRLRLSPCTNHKATDTGPITGGFDRNEMCKTCESLFDMTYDYSRKKTSSFVYFNALKNGSIEEKSEAFAAKVEEETKGLKPESNSILLNMERKKKQKECDFDFDEKELEDAQKMMDLEERITDIFAHAVTVTDIKVGFLKLNIAIKTIADNNGNLIDFKLICQDKSSYLSDIVDEENMETIFKKWETISGQITKSKADALKAAKAENERIRNTINHSLKMRR